MSEHTEVALGDVAVIDRLSIQPHDIPGDSFYLGLENIERGGRIVNVRSAEAAGIESAKFCFTKKQVLFGKLRPYLAKVARPDFDGVCSTDILPISPGPEVDRDYLAHFLMHPSTIALASSRATGANLPRLSPSELAKFRLPLPSLGEQRRVADVLDRVEGLRAKRRAAIALLDDLMQSIFLDMFGDPASDWPVLNVEEIAAPEKGAIRTGPFGSQLLHEEFVDSGVAVLGIDNAVENEFRWGKSRFITPEKYKQLSRYTVKPGDVLITIMGTCGRCAIVPDDIPTAINTKHLCCITLDRKRCLPEYLHSYFLLHPRAQSYLRKAAKGAIMSGLNMSIIKALPLHLPPIELQQDYADRLRGIQRLKASHASHLRKLDDLFGSLQQRAFRGELWDD